jgi:hypothetical protein
MKLLSEYPMLIGELLQAYEKYRERRKFWRDFRHILVRLGIGLIALLAMIAAIGGCSFLLIWGAERIFHFTITLR